MKAGKQSSKQIWTAGLIVLLAITLAAAYSLRPKNTPLRFSNGRKLVYHLTYANAAKAEFNTPTADARTATSSHDITTTLTAELALTILQNDKGESLRAYSLNNANAEIQYNNQRASADEARLIESVQREFYATVTPQGKITRLSFPSGTNAIAQNLARTLLATLQIVRPQTSTPLPDDWEVEEEDINGKYLARYQRAEGASKETSKFRKTKLRYLPAEQQQNARITPIPLTITPAGEIQLTLVSNELMVLHATEQLKTAAADKTLSSAQSELTLNLTSEEELDAPALAACNETFAAQEPTLIASTLHEAQNTKAAELRWRQNLLGNATAATLHAELQTIATATADAKAQLTDKLESLFLLRPESCTSFATQLTDANTSDVVRSLLLMAYSRAGNNEAQAVLIKTLQAQPAEANYTNVLLQAIAAVATPNQAAENLLREFAFQRPASQAQSTARLALGTLAHNLAETDAARANKIVDELAQQVNSAASLPTKQDLLAALGNAGTSAAAQHLHHLLNGTDTDVRAEAMRVLLRVEPEKADQLLITHLRENANETVRLAAARELAIRPINRPNYDALKNALQNDSSLNVRIVAMNGLWQARKEFPAATALIRQAKAKDSAEEVRRAAAKLINS